MRTMQNSAFDFVKYHNQRLDIIWGQTDRIFRRLRDCNFPTAFVVDLDHRIVEQYLLVITAYTREEKRLRLMCNAVENDLKDLSRFNYEQVREWYIKYLEVQTNVARAISDQLNTLDEMADSVYKTYSQLLDHALTQDMVFVSNGMRDTTHPATFGTRAGARINYTSPSWEHEYAQRLLTTFNHQLANLTTTIENSVWTHINQNMNAHIASLFMEWGPRSDSRVTPGSMDWSRLEDKHVYTTGTIVFLRMKGILPSNGIRIPDETRAALVDRFPETFMWYERRHMVMLYSALESYRRGTQPTRLEGVILARVLPNSEPKSEAKNTRNHKRSKFKPLVSVEAAITAANSSSSTPTDGDEYQNEVAMDEYTRFVEETDAPFQTYEDPRCRYLGRRDRRDHRGRPKYPHKLDADRTIADNIKVALSKPMGWETQAAEEFERTTKMWQGIREDEARARSLLYSNVLDVTVFQTFDWDYELGYEPDTDVISETDSYDWRLDSPCRRCRSVECYCDHIPERECMDCGAYGCTCNE
jgi:hypothetical protein